MHKKYFLLLFLFFFCINVQAKNSNQFVYLQSLQQFYLLKSNGIYRDVQRAMPISELQEVAKKIIEFVVISDTCPKPKLSHFKLLCGDLVTKTKVDGIDKEHYEYLYEKRLLEGACVNIDVDDEETVKRKIQDWWNKYKTKCTCDSVGFNVQDGNILKYALVQNLPDFIDTLVLSYDLDINFIDPVDNRNILDYVNDEIKRLIYIGVAESTVNIYVVYKKSLISLGAKPSK